jgi:hypothetical protein
MVGIEDPDVPVNDLNEQPQNPADQQIQENNNLGAVAGHPRVRRTHKDDFISSLLSKLSLREKLSKNKEIEERNKIRELSTYNHHMDPVLYPETGSEVASFITIDEADVRDLKDPSIMARFLNVVPDFLLLRIAREAREEKEEREKRKLDEHFSEFSQDAKRRRMDGSKAAERVIGVRIVRS